MRSTLASPPAATDAPTDCSTGTPNDAANDLVRALEELARAQREAAAQLARDLDRPRAGLGLLRLLERCGAVQVSDVATRLRVDVSVASRQVSTLVDAGYVRRTVDDDDRRARTIELTETGRHLAAESSRQIALLVARTFAGWTGDELATATRTIRAVAATMTPDQEEHHAR
ncbi:MarR family winged helix-turn-helix transcriptional regulator [Oerskovia flava]|uniref:MarR family winged helix-turn-helix transcriptional regulator n=1 Tax=Oerskovia flava TaxID=2986422 RepID=UPI002240A4E8|nr:MarR family winged helix-turn-helix transcriptional regulator [Oerskovia sp. JB1-3-2]